MRQFRPQHLSDVVFFTADGLIRLKDIQPYYVLGAVCMRCKSISELDRQALERRYGRNVPTYWLAERLRCKSCKNDRNNTIMVINQWPR
ncbi:hypothetical protein [Nitratireductor pacificus]|uniref:Uncharacterized protein n=1 Tax=Nitratireductor pacificus pht-3B TaxID=391937 RepID=K2M4N2_9HYPH|nr:hypothetical protein [Nitratireductor pacificus]EKF17041.1 hypothetical protein NA2_19763 [Nitratireductor pacificus pht-3B]